MDPLFDGVLGVGFGASAAAASSTPTGHTTSQNPWDSKDSARSPSSAAVRAARSGGGGGGGGSSSDEQPRSHPQQQPPPKSSTGQYPHLLDHRSEEELMPHSINNGRGGRVSGSNNVGASSGNPRHQQRWRQQQQQQDQPEQRHHDHNDGDSEGSVTAQLGKELFDERLRRTKAERTAKQLVAELKSRQHRTVKARQEHEATLSAISQLQQALGEAETRNTRQRDALDSNEYDRREAFQAVAAMQLERNQASVWVLLMSARCIPLYLKSA
jgi:hypothetical protein